MIFNRLKKLTVYSATAYLGRTDHKISPYTRVYTVLENDSINVKILCSIMTTHIKDFYCDLKEHVLNLQTGKLFFPEKQLQK